MNDTHPDPYAVLGVARTATTQQINRAYGGCCAATTRTHARVTQCIRTHPPARCRWRTW